MFLFILNYVKFQHILNINFSCDKEKESTLSILNINIQKGESQFIENPHLQDYLQILCIFI